MLVEVVIGCGQRVRRNSAQNSHEQRSADDDEEILGSLSACLESGKFVAQ